jgi:hypothetical protein
MLGEGEISLEQLYKMLHVSKRKAAWMLNKGILPCRIRPTATHRYIIRLEDVEIYLQKQRKARREEIPVGIFNAKPRKRAVLLNRQPVDTVTIAECYITLADECQEAFRAHVEKRRHGANHDIYVKGVPSACGEATPVHSRRLFHRYRGRDHRLQPRHGAVPHFQQKHIDAVRISGKYIISKAAIVDFLVSDIAFGIVNKSAWHLSTILMFSNKE